MVTLHGQALNAKAGAVVRTERETVYVEGLEAWPADLVGKLVDVSGTLTHQIAPALPVGPAGERSGGTEGPRAVIERATWTAATR
jgi:hypothetical protein